MKIAINANKTSTLTDRLGLVVKNLKIKSKLIKKVLSKSPFFVESKRFSTRKTFASKFKMRKKSVVIASWKSKNASPPKRRRWLRLC